LANQRTYEVMYIVDTDASGDDFTRLSETLQQIVTDQGGTITKTEDMGRRQLAYSIGHKTEGHYMLLEIDGTGREIAELERRMRVNDQIVRYITVRVDEDRQRAEKFKAKRARKASKRPLSSTRGSGRHASQSVAPAPVRADEDLES
jgi:small subunit ribosomal protein S6